LEASAPPAPPRGESESNAREVKQRARFDFGTWVAAYEEHGTVVAACKVVGISPDTAYRRRRESEEFASMWDEAEGAVTEVLEKTLVQIALDPDHKDQVRALEFALKSRRPDKYRENVRLEHGGTINHNVEVGIDAALVSLEERLGLIAPPESSVETTTPGDPSPRALASGN